LRRKSGFGQGMPAASKLISSTARTINHTT
jgi:hypothetical protein